MDLGKVIKEYRLTHGLSLRAFAKKCGLSHTYIDNIEKDYEPHTGKPVTPSISALQALAKGMDVPLEELMEKAGYTASDEDRENYLDDCTGVERENKTIALPYYVKNLSPDLREFLLKEAAEGWPRLELLHKAELQGLTPEELEKTLRFLFDLKRRDTEGGGFETKR